MNRKLLALLMAAITLPVAAEQYIKPGAVLTLHPGQDNAEFLTAVAGGDVASTQAFSDDFSQKKQRPVSLGMSPSVVVPFEVVDVDHHKRQGALGYPRQFDVFLQNRQQIRFVVEPGHAVFLT